MSLGLIACATNIGTKTPQRQFEQVVYENRCMYAQMLYLGYIFGLRLLGPLVYYLKQYSMHRFINHLVSLVCI